MIHGSTDDLKTRADEIRGWLKADHGLTRKTASVKTSSFGYGSDSITIRLKARAQLTEIRLRARSYGEQRFCEASGEPLMGCNHYIDVDYDSAFLRAEAERRGLDAFASTLVAQLEDLPPGQGVRAGDDLWLFRDGPLLSLSSCLAHWRTHGLDKRSLALCLTRIALDSTHPTRTVDENH